MEEKDKTRGTLYICATPIGNLEDITYRVVRTLSEVDLIAAEDTRTTLKLLNHWKIRKPLTSYHEHNRVEKADELVELLLEGKNIALVTDAGTPAISDPGEELVRRCALAGVAVTSLPGPSPVVTALSLSALSSRRFAFEGFLPADKKERRAVLEELKEEPRTIVLYEAPHRLAATVAELYGALGDRKMTLCRELTKIHEEVRRTSLGEEAGRLSEEEPRGEYVLVIEGKSREEITAGKQEVWQQVPLSEHMDRYLSRGLDRKEAMRRVAQDRGVSRRDIYQALMKQENE